MKNKATLLLFFSTVIVLFSGCATLFSYDPQQPEVVVTKASSDELRRFGINYDVNPYLDKKSILSGWVTDTFVLKIKMNFPVDTRIYITAEMKTLDGKNAAQAYDNDALIQFWEENSERDSETALTTIQKNKNIRKSCIPGFSFNQKAGQATYFLPFIGWHPIQKPAKVFVQVATGKGEPIIYTYTLE